MTTNEVSIAIGHLHTDPDGTHTSGWFFLSAIFWINPPFIYFLDRIRNVLSQMSPSDISSYLSTNILTIGISSLTPMMYLSLDSIKCPSNVDRTQKAYAQCSGVSSPQSSICMFLLIIMIIKVLIAPLFTTTLATNDLIKFNIPQRLIFQGALFGLSFLLNLYLFTNMEEGKVIDSVKALTWIANFLALIPLFLEFFHIVFHHAHRTSLIQSPQSSLTSPSGNISLSPADSLSRDPTQSGVTDGFV